MPSSLSYIFLLVCMSRCMIVVSGVSTAGYGISQSPTSFAGDLTHIAQNSTGTGETATYTPELCWNTSTDRRPNMWVQPFHVEHNSHMHTCQTLCSITYSSCTALAFSSRLGLCKLYDQPLGYLDMSMDEAYVTQQQSLCQYDLLYVPEKMGWDEAQQLVCPGMNGELTSVMDKQQQQQVKEMMPAGINEVWVGLLFVNGSGIWENGATVFHQTYEIQQPEDNQLSKACGRAVRDDSNSLRIEAANCDSLLPAVCQFKPGALPTSTPPTPSKIPYWQHDLYIRYVKTRAPPTTTTTTTVRVTKSPTTTKPPPPTLKVPIPVAKTSGPFSTDPVDVSIGASMSFLLLGVIIGIVVLDISTIAKELIRLRKNLAGCCSNCIEEGDGTYDPPPELLVTPPKAKTMVSSTVHTLSLPVSMYRDYNQLYQPV